MRRFSLSLSLYFSPSLFLSFSVFHGGSLAFFHLFIHIQLHILVIIVTKEYTVSSANRYKREKKKTQFTLKIIGTLYGCLHIIIIPASFERN